jgi:hypothetical protein
LSLSPSKGSDVPLGQATSQRNECFDNISAECCPAAKPSTIILQNSAVKANKKAIRVMSAEGIDGFGLPGVTLQPLDS